MFGNYIFAGSVSLDHLRPRAYKIKAAELLIVYRVHSFEG